MLLTTPRTPVADNFFTATCGAGVAVGDFVWVSAAGPTVVVVDIDAVSAQLALGVIVSKPTPTSCVVQRAGELKTSGLTPGAWYFISPSGQAVTPRPPNPVSGKRSVQFVGQAITTTRLGLNISPTLTRVLPL